MDDTQSWFVILPDRPCPPDLVNRLRRHATYLVTHASNRPWLMGSWPIGHLLLTGAEDVRLAISGICSLTAKKLAGRLKKIRTPADVEAVASGASGSFHVLASVGGVVYARGDLSGTRRLYATTIGDITVGADRARTLAWLVGAGLDITQLAARLVTPFLPYPLASGAMWRGVRAVTPGKALLIGALHTSLAMPWWQAPPGDLPLAEAAPSLAEALRGSVRVRVRPGDVLGVDLSGGMDSTSVCFLAAEAGAQLITATLQWSAPGNQDGHFAGIAADLLPAVEHIVLPSDTLPAQFSGLHDRRDPGDEPTLTLRDQAQQRCLADELRTHGATHRLTGHGGDHVVQPPDAYLHTLLRRNLRRGIRHFSGVRAKRRWPLRAAAATLLDAQQYGNRLAESAAHLWENSPIAAPLPYGWGPRPHLPAWANPQAAELIVNLLCSAAGYARPLIAEPALHAWIEVAQEAGRTAAHLAYESFAAGLIAHSPFCDDNVINACMSARLHEAADPWSYKPLLAAAMDGVVPPTILARTTKDHCGLEWYAGLRLHLPDLMDWAEHSHLVAAGVIDRQQLRYALMSPELLGMDVGELEFTLGAEKWLRDLAAYPVPAYLRRDDSGRPHIYLVSPAQTEEEQLSEQTSP